MARGKTTVKDMGAKRIRKLARSIAANKPGVKVGVLADAGFRAPDPSRPGAPPVRAVDVAVWMEFGTSKIPEKPFMRTSTAELDPIMAHGMAIRLQEMINGDLTMAVALNQLGMVARNHIRNKIASWSGISDKASTVLRKIAAAKKRGLGVGDTLVDTGQLIRDIQFKKTGPLYEKVRETNDG